MNYKITATSPHTDGDTPDKPVMYTFTAEEYTLRAISTNGGPIFDDCDPFAFDDAAIDIGLLEGGDYCSTHEEFEEYISEFDLNSTWLPEEISIWDIGSTGIRDYFVAALYTLGYNFTQEEIEEPYYYDDAMQQFLLRE